MRKTSTIIFAVFAAAMLPNALFGQRIFIADSSSIPSEIETMYVKGMNYLSKTQNEQGVWTEGHYGRSAGVIGLCIVAILAHGDDPNSGPYSLCIKRGLGAIFAATNQSNGYIGDSMYNHGFATLALAEAYGTVNDDRIGPALKKAVDLILSSQARNPKSAWRYGPDSRDADTTVSGAALVALFAAANAGVAVPDEAIQKALKFYESTQGDDGGFGYTNRSSSSYPRAAIGALVFALAKKKESSQFKNAFSYLNGHNAAESGSSYYHYGLYYAAQVFFHAGPEAWGPWNEVNAKLLKAAQQENGGWNGDQGAAFTTAASLLSIALNYRYLPIYER